MCVEIRMVASGLTQEDAFLLEAERISFWRSNNIDLANYTDGGDGNRGYKQTSASNIKRSLKNKELGIKPPVFSGAQNPFFGKKHTQETRQKLSQAMKGRKLSDEDKKKRSDYWTPERKKALSEKIKLIWATRKASKNAVDA